MNRRKYYIMVTEGVTDCSLIEAVLEKYLGYNPYQNVRELPSLFEAMIGIYPMRSGELKRQVNNPVSVSMLSGERKPRFRFLGNHHSRGGNHYYKYLRM